VDDRRSFPRINCCARRVCYASVHEEQCSSSRNRIDAWRNSNCRYPLHCLFGNCRYYSSINIYQDGSPFPNIARLQIQIEPDRSFGPLIFPNVGEWASATIMNIVMLKDPSLFCTLTLNSRIWARSRIKTIYVAPSLLQPRIRQSLST
jgi:hypothetical protein